MASTPGSEPAGLAKGSKESLGRALDDVFCFKFQYLLGVLHPLMTYVPPLKRLGEEHLDGGIEMRNLRKQGLFGPLPSGGAWR